MQHINRRQFLIATAAVATSGCGSIDSGESSGSAHVGGIVNAGALSRYAKDGVYDAYADQGFFIISRQGKLTILSAICTHRTCKLKAEPDHSFYCKCHGSAFDPEGRVTEGPARRPLPELAFAINDRQELIVTVPKS